MIQLSVYLEDKPGELSKFIKLLMDNKIFIRALTVAKTSEYGLILFLVDDPEKCINLLEKKDFKTTRTHFKPTALRTTANIDDLKDILLKLRQ